MPRVLRLVSRLVARHAGIVALVALLLTVFLCWNARRLRMGTDLTGLFRKSDPHWQVVREFTERLGYGNQLFVMIEHPRPEEASAEEMEDAAERLASDLRAGGLVKSVRYGLTEAELLGVVNLFSANFLVLTEPARQGEIASRLQDGSIRKAVRRARLGLVSAFSTLGTSYFVSDPLGLAEVAAGQASAFTSFGNFDLEWGSGNRFFSRDHKALLVIVEPLRPAVDYEFAERMVRRLKERFAAWKAEDRQSKLSFLIAGAHIYAEEDRRFIGKNIRLISVVSIVGNLLLCVVVYPRIPLLLLSMLPTTLGILWTTGIITFYPGEVNLISLAFIAILAGLGDDQVVHFLNRIPQQWSKGGTLDQAVERVYATTGQSVVFCILATSMATGALAAARFKALSEFGLILTIGMVMLMLHTLLTVPALMRLWWRISPPQAPESVRFRFLPAISNWTAAFLEKRAKVALAISAVLLAASAMALPRVRLDRKLEMARATDHPAIVGQKRLAAKYGIEGTPYVYLIRGGEAEVLRKAEALTAQLKAYGAKGTLKAVVSPSSILPSFEEQEARARAAGGLNFARAAKTLESALRESGFETGAFRPAIERLAWLANGPPKRLTIDGLAAYLPAGLLANSIRKVGDDAVIAAIAYYPTDPDASPAIPDHVVAEWQRKIGTFSEFSFDKINRDVQAQVLGDSRQALVLTGIGVVAIVALCFRRLGASLFVLFPLVFSVAVTFGQLYALHYRFSFMSLTALPLIVGMSIDNGIHVVGRYVEDGGTDILEIVRSSGPALIQSNLTTIVGFGALTVSTFEPLAELGLVTALGVAWSLVGVLWVIPSTILVLERRTRAASTAPSR